VKLFHTLAAILTIAATSLVAQTPKLACDGDITTVRVSEIKPEGTLAGFMSAVAAHKAWYRANGITDNEIYTARVIVRDETTKEKKYSDKQVMTFPVNPPSSDRTPNHGDAAYNAFVKLYKDNSDIKSEYSVCMPRSPRK
jgi:hypothetical protein